jgi:hypothetical protein
MEVACSLYRSDGERRLPGRDGAVGGIQAGVVYGIRGTCDYSAGRLLRARAQPVQCEQPRWRGSGRRATERPVRWGPRVASGGGCLTTRGGAHPPPALTDLSARSPSPAPVARLANTSCLPPVVHRSRCLRQMLPTT